MKICGAAIKRSAALFRAAAERSEQAAIFASANWPRGEGSMVTTKSRGKEQPVLSRTEQRAIVIEALGIVPNVLQVYRCLGKRIGVSYGTIWNIAKAEGIELTRVDGRRVAKSGAAQGTCR
jgi:hypothetical protein